MQSRSQSPHWSFSSNSMTDAVNSAPTTKRPSRAMATTRSATTTARAVPNSSRPSAAPETLLSFTVSASATTRARSSLRTARSASRPARTTERSTPTASAASRTWRARTAGASARRRDTSTMDRAARRAPTARTTTGSRRLAIPLARPTRPTRLPDAVRVCVVDRDPRLARPSAAPPTSRKSDTPASAASPDRRLTRTATVSNLLTLLPRGRGPSPTSSSPTR